MSGASSDGKRTNGNRPAEESSDGMSSDRKSSDQAGSDQKTRVTVLVALAANLVIAVAKAVGGVFAGSPALLSEAAHSVADSFNEVFLLFALHRSKRPADRQHPFGYGKERFFWALLAAVGIFVMGGCFSFLQGVEALRGGNKQESTDGYIVGFIVLGVALAAEGSSLLRAVIQVRNQPGEGIGKDPALRTVIAEDGTAVVGVLLAMGGMALHMVTREIVWEASASLAIGVLLVYIAYRLGKDAREQLIGEAADPGLRDRIEALLNEQPEIDVVSSLLTMRLGLDSTLVAARIDLVPGLESEHMELVSMRIKAAIAERWPEADQVYLDVTDAARAAAGDTP